MSVSLPTIAILGAGSMGGAILSGLKAVGADVRVTTRSAASATSIAGAISTEADPEANRMAVMGARVVLLGVKPLMFRPPYSIDQEPDTEDQVGPLELVQQFPQETAYLIL